METAGTIYSLDPDTLNAVDAPNDTVSLVYCAPAVVDRLLVVDQSAGDTYWHYGSSLPEASDNRYTRVLPQKGRLAEVRRALDLL
ncbi:hypothetical protein [Brevundimonas nasdae]|uniref:hypothetical protein n=1 Tax=Brevundimonas nasdae TaxID=172043 RepID=UPI003F68F900